MRKAIIIVSFGTANLTALRESIEVIENSIEEKYKNYYKVLRTFTSKFIINKLKKDYGIDRLYIEEALTYLKEGNYEEVIIQPLNIISGREIKKIKEIAISFKENFKRIKVGLPLLTEEKRDSKILAKILCKGIDKNNNIIFVGHGVANDNFNYYEEIENNFRSFGYNNIYIGALEGSTNINNMVSILKNNKIKHIELRPLLLSCGNHVVKDICGKDNDSWQNILCNAGIKVKVNLKSLGEYEEIRKIYLKRIEACL